MTDPSTAAAAAGWVVAVIVMVIQGLRAKKPDQLDDIRAVVHAEVAPVMLSVDRTEHEIGVLKQEIGHATAHSEITADNVRKLRDEMDERFGQMGEAFDRRTTRLEERVGRIVTDSELADG